MLLVTAPRRRWYPPRRAGDPPECSPRAAGHPSPYVPGGWPHPDRCWMVTAKPHPRRAPDPRPRCASAPTPCGASIASGCVVVRVSVAGTGTEGGRVRWAWFRYLCGDRRVRSALGGAAMAECGNVVLAALLWSVTDLRQGGCTRLEDGQVIARRAAPLRSCARTAHASVLSNAAKLWGRVDKVKPVRGVVGFRVSNGPGGSRRLTPDNAALGYSRERANPGHDVVAVNELPGHTVVRPGGWITLGWIAPTPLVVGGSALCVARRRAARPADRCCPARCRGGPGPSRRPRRRYGQDPGRACRGARAAW